MFQKIIEYLAILVIIFTFGATALSWMFSGSLLKAFFGFVLLCIISGSTFVLSIREILYYCKKDGQ